MARIPTFDGAVDHRRIDRDAWDDLYVAGDVHGCRRDLERLLGRLDLGREDLLVLVGDLVRKGPDSTGVIDLVREHPNVISVRGNNEAKLLGGEASLGLDARDLAWLANLPVAVSWEGGLVVHGGVDPERPIADHDAAELLTMRSPHGDGYDGPFWFDDYEGPPRVFFGHTVLETPVERRWAVGLDTGCVYGGGLTAYDIDRGWFVSVEAEETHQQRPARKILTPRASEV